MDVLVCLKRVPLAGGTLILTPDAKDIETKHLGFGISRFTPRQIGIYMREVIFEAIVTNGKGVLHIAASFFFRLGGRVITYFFIASSKPPL
jgi:hypothetical protein